MADLETVIEDSVTDSTAIPMDDVSTETVSEDLETAGTESTETMEVGSPATRGNAEDANERPSEAAMTDLEKRLGITAQAEGGRENRIPYSRVKKIVENAERGVEKRLADTYTKQSADFQTKIQEYEGRLHQVAQFEQVMLNDAPRFLEMLNRMPAYQQIFAHLRNQGAPQAQTTTGESAGAAAAEMPQPNQKLADGSMVYDMDGLKQLMGWHAKQVQNETMQRVQQTYEPIRQDWETYQRTQQMIPQVQRQIDEARRWPQFTEHENDITQALQNNPHLSLEGAYRAIVLPKLSQSQDELRKSIRAQVMAELKKAPATTAVPSHGSRPNPPAGGGNRSIEDIIREQVGTLGGR